ncbi:protein DETOXIFICATION 34-like [Spinacia oleracea]|uniref:Protein DETOXIFICATION 34-like n=1 Tax=Spinacia oleracea TaxID=3562 RepID=A0ABM3QR21_SPIOL|nr:protein DETOXIFICATION 34-like [Spinacia oleracea]
MKSSAAAARIGDVAAAALIGAADAALICCLHARSAAAALVLICYTMNLNGWEGMLFIGINAAIGVRVSNELGSGNARAAKYSVIVIVSQSLYIESKDMQNVVAHLAYLLGITMVLNSVQPVISGSSIILLIIGVAVGGGWQALVAYVNLFSYYVIGLPLGYFLGYKTPLGVEGVVLQYAWYLDRNDNRN